MSCYWSLVGKSVCWWYAFTKMIYYIRPQNHYSVITFAICFTKLILDTIIRRNHPHNTLSTHCLKWSNFRPLVKMDPQDLPVNGKKRPFQIEKHCSCNILHTLDNEITPKLSLAHTFYYTPIAEGNKAALRLCHNFEMWKIHIITKNMVLIQWHQ